MWIGAILLRKQTAGGPLAYTYRTESFTECGQIPDQLSDYCLLKGSVSRFQLGVQAVDVVSEQPLESFLHFPIFSSGCNTFSMVNNYSLFSVSSALTLLGVSFIFPGVLFRLSTSQQFSHSRHPTPTCSPPPFCKHALFTQRRCKTQHGIEVVSRPHRTQAHSRPERVDNKLHDSGHYSS